MALREIQRFRRYFWNVTHYLVPEPLPLRGPTESYVATLSVPVPPSLNELKRKAFIGSSTSSGPQILCRVVDAITGTSVPGPGADIGKYLQAMTLSEIEIFLRLRLVNQEEPPITFMASGWIIELTDGAGEYLATGKGQTIGDMFFSKQPPYFGAQRKKERFDKDIITEVSKIPMDVNVPVEGWARFAVSGLTLFHAFGATIKMTAETDGGRKWCGLLKPPGKWLIPAEFSYQADVTEDKK
jgi:hypothetical protein